jgi:hypothetical protein
MNSRSQRIAVGLAGVVVLGAGPTAWAVARGGGDQVPLTADALRARDAAVAAVGGGTPNAVERDGENGATWEVEVTRLDGVTVDVRLDALDRVVVVEPDADPVVERTGSDLQDRRAHRRPVVVVLRCDRAHRLALLRHPRADRRCAVLRPVRQHPRPERRDDRHQGRR